MRFFKLLLIAIAPLSPILFDPNPIKITILKFNVIRFFKLLLIVIAPSSPILFDPNTINNKNT